MFEWTAYPGRCPGLVCDAPFGAEDGRCDRSLKSCGSRHGIHSGLMLVSGSMPIPSPTPRRGRDKSARATPEEQRVINRSALQGRHNNQPNTPPLNERRWCVPQTARTRQGTNQAQKKRPHRLTARKIGAVDGCGRWLRSTGDIHSIER
jgi:hypothetical protein